MSTEVMSHQHDESSHNQPDNQSDNHPNEITDDDLISQLDSLDDQSLRDPSAYFQLLALMEPRLNAIQSINQLKENVTADLLSKDSTANIDLNQSINQPVMIESIAKERTKVLEQLSRSKMNFLHVQTKRLLIEALLPMNLPAPTKNDLEFRLAEQSISDAKLSLDTNKRQLDETIKEIKSKAFQFTVEYDQLIHQSNSFQDEFDPEQFARLTQQMIDCGLDPNNQSSYDDEVMNQLLEQEQSSIAELEAQIRLVDEQIEGQLNDVANNENTITQLQKQIEDDQAIYQSFNRTMNQAELDWYQGIIDAISGWNGISIISAQSERSLKIQISPINHSNKQSNHQPNDLIIEVDVNPHNVLEFNGGVICSGHLSDATWDRLLDSALDKQDLPGLLRALQEAISDEQNQSNQTMNLSSPDEQQQDENQAQPMEQ